MRLSGGQKEAVNLRHERDSKARRRIVLFRMLFMPQVLLLQLPLRIYIDPARPPRAPVTNSIIKWLQKIKNQKNRLLLVCHTPGEAGG